MSKVLENIKKQASALNKCIVLPEGEDSRVVVAAAQAVKDVRALLGALPAAVAFQAEAFTIGEGDLQLGNELGHIPPVYFVMAPAGIVCFVVETVAQNGGQYVIAAA